MIRPLNAIRELGVLPGFFYLADRAVERIFSRRMFYYYSIYYSIVAQPVVEPRLRPAKDLLLVTCTSWSDLEPYLDQIEISEAIIRERFDRNYHCVLLIRGTSLLGFGWVALGDYLEDEVRCRFVPAPPEETGWDFDVFVHPDHRGTLVFVRLWDALNQYYVSQGRKWTLSRISRFNVMSFQSHKSLKAKRMRDVLFVVIGRMQLMFCRARPFVHLSISTYSYPTLRLPVDNDDRDH